MLRCAGGDPAGERVYRLYRGRLDRAEDMVVGRFGVIASGSLQGIRIRDMLQAAAREGWLAYRRRPDGWYSAEWADGRIALCGPVKRLSGAVTRLSEKVTGA
jgi:hypothetical protein